MTEQAVNHSYAAVWCTLLQNNLHSENKQIIAFMPNPPVPPALFHLQRLSPCKCIWQPPAAPPSPLFAERLGVVAGQTLELTSPSDSAIPFLVRFLVRRRRCAPTAQGNKKER